MRYRYKLGYFKADVYVLQWVTAWEHDTGQHFINTGKLREGWCAVAMDMHGHWVPRVVRVENLEKD